MTSSLNRRILTHFSLAIALGAIAFSLLVSEASSHGSGDGRTSVSVNPVENNNGIVYFSMDNGLTWESKNAGLPSNISVGLGGIAVSGNTLALLSQESGLYLFDFGKGSWVKTPANKQLLESNPCALTFHRDRIYAGTQFGGVFFSHDKGKNWAQQNTGLSNLTIRKLSVIDRKLYAATNAGLYSHNDILGRWELEYGASTLQVNGIAVFDGNIYIATTQGAFTTPKGRKAWKKIFAGGALHNISADDRTLYAMVYNELFSSTDKGASWQSIQRGLPAHLYTFNVAQIGNAVFAGQWDGVYRKDTVHEDWKRSGMGLPDDFAITNIQLYQGIIVVSGSERKLRPGVTIDK